MLFPNTCLLYDAFKADDFALANLSAWREAARGVMPVVALVHAPPGAPPFPPTGGPDIILTDADIFDGIAHRKQPARAVVPGNVDLKLIAGMRRLPAYDRFIKVEYDVVAARRPYDSLLRLATLAAQCDLAGHNPRPWAATDNWPHWHTFVAPNGDTAQRIDKACKIFLPLMTISRPLVEAVERYLAEGWRGHFECLIPTIAAREGMLTRDTVKEDPRLTDHGPFHWLKPDLETRPVPDFIHPVKSFADYDALPVIVRRNVRR